MNNQKRVGLDHLALFLGEPAMGGARKWGKRSLVLNLPLDDGSQMSREIQIRFLESAGGKLPCATHLVKFGKRTKIPWKKEKFFLKQTIDKDCEKVWLPTSNR